MWIINVKRFIYSRHVDWSPSAPLFVPHQTDEGVLPAHCLVGQLSHSVELLLHLPAVCAWIPMEETPADIPHLKNNRQEIFHGSGHNERSLFGVQPSPIANENARNHHLRVLLVARDSGCSAERLWRGGGGEAGHYGKCSSVRLAGLQFDSLKVARTSCVQFIRSK